MKENTTVFVVSSKFCGDFFIDAAFSTKQQAEDFITQHEMSSGYITELTIDEPSEYTHDLPFRPPSKTRRNQIHQIKTAKTMKQQKSTIKRLAQFAESYDSDIIFIALMSVLLAIVIVIPILFDKIAWAFCAPLALILVYMIVRGILDLINTYRWYFGLDKDKSKQKEL